MWQVFPQSHFLPPSAVSDNEARLKYVDDLSIAECVELTAQLVANIDELVLPPTKSVLQSRLDDVTEAAEVHDMKPG